MALIAAAVLMGGAGPKPSVIITQVSEDGEEIEGSQTAICQDDSCGATVRVAFAQPAAICVVNAAISQIRLTASVEIHFSLVGCGGANVSGIEVNPRLVTLSRNGTFTGIVALRLNSESVIDLLRRPEPHSYVRVDAIFPNFGK